MELLWLWIVLGIVAVLIIVVIVLHNSLVTLKNRVQEAWSDITVQLKHGPISSEPDQHCQRLRRTKRKSSRR